MSKNNFSVASIKFRGMLDSINIIVHKSMFWDNRH